MGRRKLIGLQVTPLSAGMAAAICVLGAAWSWRATTVKPLPSSWEELAAGAVQAIKAGDLEHAYQMCDQATQLASPPRPGDVRLSRSQTLLGEIHYSAGKPELAEQAFQQAVATCEQTCGPQSPELCEPLDALANFYYYRDEFAQVEPLYRRIDEITDLALTRAEREVANRARNLAEVERRLGQFVEAEAGYKKCLAVGEKLGDIYKSDLIHDMITVADFYIEWGNIEEAQTLAEQSLKMAEAEMGPNSMDTGLALDCLSKVYLAADKPEQAEPLSVRALRITEQLSGEESSDLAPRLALLAEVMQAQAKYVEAQQQLQRALAVTENDLGPESPEMATLLDQHAVVLTGLGKTDEAEAASARAGAIREQIERPDPGKVPDCAECQAK